MASAAQHASTEDLREAMVHYRALFAELLDDDTSDREQTSRRSPNGSAGRPRARATSRAASRRGRDRGRRPRGRTATPRTSRRRSRRSRRASRARRQSRARPRAALTTRPAPARRERGVPEPLGEDPDRFVDEPRQTVEQADELVAQVMQRLAEGFAAERERLEQPVGPRRGRLDRGPARRAAALPRLLPAAAVGLGRGSSGRAPAAARCGRVPPDDPGRQRHAPPRSPDRRDRRPGRRGRAAWATRASGSRTRRASSATCSPR